MSAFVQFSQITVHFGERPILVNVSLNLKSGTKAALCGDNGSGKTTLLRVLAGVIEADTGERSVQKGARLSYLPQSVAFDAASTGAHAAETLRAYADHAFDWGHALVAEQERIAEVLAAENTSTGGGRESAPPQASPTGFSESAVSNTSPGTGSGGIASGGASGGTPRVSGGALLRRYQEISDTLEGIEWNRRNERCDTVLSGLGFSRAEFSRAMAEFSPGWQMRAALARVLLEAPDFLLLDEPTNYLDLEARNWLEDFLSDFRGGFLLVSHDRYFLDATVTEVYELFSGTLRRYKGNYSAYEKIRAGELETLAAAYKEQQLEIQKLEDFIRRFGYKATKAAAAQERQKMLDKMVRIEIPETLKKIHFRFPDPPHSGRLAITLTKVGKTYGPRANSDYSSDFTPASAALAAGGAAVQGKKTVLRDIDLVIERGEKLVVTGPNGAGKSTLLRIIAAADRRHDGAVTYGAGVSTAYYSQDNPETLDSGKTLAELVETACPAALVPKVRDLLGAFLFRGDDVYKTVAVLSGGERSRAALLLMLLRPANVLILDEPTNHLDLHSKDVLLEALRAYSGTVVFVSHDRGFIEALATRVLDLIPPPENSAEPSAVLSYPGDYAYYLAQKAKRAGGGIGAGGGSASRLPDSGISPGQRAAFRSPEGSGGPGTAGTDFGAGNIAKAGALRGGVQGAHPLASKTGTGAVLVKNEKRRREREEHRLLAAITAAEEKKAALESALSRSENYSDGEKSRALQKDLADTDAEIQRLTVEWETVAVV